MESAVALFAHDEAELCLAVRNGSQQAFSELWRRHYGEVLGYARKLSVIHAEDAVSDVMTTVYAAFQAGKGPCDSFRSYVLMSVRNRIYFLSAQPSHDELPIEDLLPSAQQEYPVETEEHLDMLRDALDELPERWRRVLIMREVENTPVMQIGERLGMAPNAVSALLRRARSGLRQSWSVQQSTTL